MKYIFVHGLGQNSSSWEETISYMGKTTQISRPNLFDLLEDKELTYNNLYLAFSRYVEESSEPVILIGLSLGAVLALNYTIEHPSRVESLVLIAPQYKMPKLLLKVQNTIFRFMPESPFQKLGSNKKDFILLLNSMMELDFSKELNRVQCNTLVLYGENDKANKRAAEKLAEQITKAEIRIVKGVGHEVNMEDPEALAVKLNEFLKQYRN